MSLLSSIRAWVGGAKPDQEAEPSLSSDDMNKAALNVLHFKMASMNTVSQWLYQYSQADIDRERAKITQVRQWAVTQPPSVRRAYEYWLEYYEHGVDEAQEELNTGREKRKMDAYIRRMDEESGRARSVNIPKPPI
jgi:hypothetical protein